MNQVVEMFMNSTAPATTGQAHGLAPAPLSPSAQRIEFSELPDAVGAMAKPTLLQSINPLHQIKASLQVCVGSATLTVGELMSAREHQVLLLDRSIEQPVDLVLEGQIVARGQLVAVDNQLAVGRSLSAEVPKLPAQLTPEEIRALGLLLSGGAAIGPGVGAASQ